MGDLFLSILDHPQTLFHLKVLLKCKVKIQLCNLIYEIPFTVIYIEAYIISVVLQF